MLCPRLLSRLSCALPLYVAAPALAHAQTTPPSTSHCNGQRISDIHVSALRPPFTGEAAYWRRVAHSLGLHHTTTDTVVVRRFLALQKGGVCTDFRMRESARLLREEPFIANARVWAVPADSGRVRIEVETVDEIPVVASGAVAAGRPSYLEVGNQNMFGDAWLLAIHGSNRILEGQSAGFRFSDYQFLGRQYEFDAQTDWGNRTSAWLLDASHAYLTDLQRIAWEAGIAHAGQQFLVIHRGDDVDDLGIAYRRTAADVGGVIKLGNLRTPILVGSILTMQQFEPLNGLSIAKNNALVPDTTLLGRYGKFKRARLTGVGAWRNLNFITVQGFDALTGTQDLPTGLQIFGQLGRGTHAFQGQSDVFALADMLAGVGSGKTYAELHLVSEGQRLIGQLTWQGVVSSGWLASYWKPTDPSLFRAWIDYAGGWKIQTPFQLQLSTEDERLIGYHGSLFGARRVASGVLYRRLLPNVSKRADVAIGAFVNAGRLWQGDAPFGVDTPVLTSAGVSLFGALPKGSQRILRIDFGTALRSGLPRSGWEVRLTYDDVGRRIREEPRDIAAARVQLVGPDVFRP
jgi:hypothetical protein